eukprot:g4716.t1
MNDISERGLRGRRRKSPTRYSPSKRLVAGANAALKRKQPVYSVPVPAPDDVSLPWLTEQIFDGKKINSVELQDNDGFLPRPKVDLESRRRVGRKAGTQPMQARVTDVYSPSYSEVDTAVATEELMAAVHSQAKRKEESLPVRDELFNEVPAVVTAQNDSRLTNFGYWVGRTSLIDYHTRELLEGETEELQEDLQDSKAKRLAVEEHNDSIRNDIVAAHRMVQVTEDEIEEDVVLLGKAKSKTEKARVKVSEIVEQCRAQRKKTRFEMFRLSQIETRNTLRMGAGSSSRPGTPSDSDVEKPHHHAGGHRPVRSLSQEHLADVNNILENHDSASHAVQARNLLQKAISKQRLDVRLRKRRTMREADHSGQGNVFAAAAAAATAAARADNRKGSNDAGMQFVVNHESKPTPVFAFAGMGAKARKKMNKEKKKKRKKEKKEKDKKGKKEKEKEKEKKKKKKNKKQKKKEKEKEKEKDKEKKAGKEEKQKGKSVKSGGNHAGGKSEGNAVTSGSSGKKAKTKTKRTHHHHHHHHHKRKWPSSIQRMGVTIRFLQQLLGKVAQGATMKTLRQDVIMVETKAFAAERQSKTSTPAAAGAAGPKDAVKEPPLSFVELKKKGHRVCYTDILEAQDSCDFHGNPNFGQATHFVSYVREQSVMTLVSALDVFINLQEANPASMFFWIDILSLPWGCEEDIVTLDYLNDLRRAIGRIGNTVSIVSPWTRPLALQRRWCIFELVATVESGSNLFVSMDGKGYGEFQKALHTGSGFESAVSALASSNVSFENSSCNRESDGALLLRSIGRGDGKDRIRKAEIQLRRELKAWVANAAARALQSIYDGRHSNNTSEERRISTLCECIIRAYREVGGKHLVRAEQPARRLLALSAPGTERIHAMQSLASLLVLIDSQRHRKSRRGRRKLSKVGSTMNVHDREDTGSLTASQTLLTEAELLFRRALAMQESSSPTNPETLQSINNFAVFCQRVGKPQEAEVLYRRALKGLIREHGENHLHVFQAMHNLASLLQAAGNIAAAEKLFQQAYAGRLASLGPEAPVTLQTRFRLAQVSRELGQSEVAAQMFAGIAESRESSKDFGPLHHDTLEAYEQLAACLMDKRALPEAERLLHRVLDSRRTKLGESDPATLRCASDLGACLYAQGKLEEAEEMHRAVLDAHRAVDRHSVETLRAMSNLASVCNASGRLEEAAKLYAEALGGYEKRLGKNDSCTLLCVDALARALKGIGKFQDAARLFKRCGDGYSRSLGAEHPDALRALGNFGICMKAVGKTKEGEDAMRRAMEATAATASPSRPQRRLSQKLDAALKAHARELMEERKFASTNSEHGHRHSFRLRKPSWTRKERKGSTRSPTRSPKGDIVPMPERRRPSKVNISREAIAARFAEKRASLGIASRSPTPKRPTPKRVLAPPRLSLKPSPPNEKRSAVSAVQQPSPAAVARNLKLASGGASSEEEKMP